MKFVIAPQYKHYSVDKWLPIFKGCLIIAEGHNAFSIQVSLVVVEVVEMFHLGELVM